MVLCPEAGEGARPSMDDFMQAFDVVFVDVTGYLNLALGMTKSLYSRVRRPLCDYVMYCVCVSVCLHITRLHILVL